MEALKERFLANMDRHPEVSWEDVAEKLADPAKAAAVAWMEETGGEPDVVALGGGWAIVDCSKEVPAGRCRLLLQGPGSACQAAFVER